MVAAKDNTRPKGHTLRSCDYQNVCFGFHFHYFSTYTVRANEATYLYDYLSYIT